MDGTCEGYASFVGFHGYIGLSFSEIGIVYWKN